MPPTVSVIVRTYNRAHLVVETLRSIAGQSEPDLEILVVDDGSTDSTGDVVERFGRSEPRLRLLRRDHGGASSALNAGVAAARGAYLSFLDSDDLWEPSCVARRLEALRTHPSLGAALVDWVSFGDPGQPPRPSLRATLDRTEGDLLQILFRKHFFSLCSAMIPAEVAAGVGVFDESVLSAEDYDWGLRLALARPIVFLPDVLLRVRSHPDCLTADPRVCRFRCRVLERFAEAHADRLPAGLIRDRLAEVNAAAGDSLLRVGDSKEARPFLLQSLRRRPCQGRVLKNLLRTWWGSAPAPRAGA